jgi:hypothetical protein
VIAGRADFIFCIMSSCLPHVEGGRLRAVAAPSPERIPAFPEIKTMVELGYPALAAGHPGGRNQIGIASAWDWCPYRSGRSLAGSTKEPPSVAAGGIIAAPVARLSLHLP